MKVMFAAIVSICMSVTAQFLLKSGVAALRAPESPQGGFERLVAVATNWPLVGGFLTYAAGAIVWLYVLAHWEVSKAYPLVGLGFVLTAGISYFFANEHVTAARLVGIALICCGVFVVSRS